MIDGNGGPLTTFVNPVRGEHASTTEASWNRFTIGGVPVFSWRDELKPTSYSSVRLPVESYPQESIAQFEEVGLEK